MNTKEALMFVYLDGDDSKVLAEFNLDDQAAVSMVTTRSKEEARAWLDLFRQGRLPEIERPPPIWAPPGETYVPPPR